MTSCHVARGCRGVRSFWNVGSCDGSLRSCDDSWNSHDGWSCSCGDERWSCARPCRQTDASALAWASVGTAAAPRDSTACPAAAPGEPTSAERGLTSQGFRATRLSKCQAGCAVRSWPEHNCTCCRDHDKKREFRRCECKAWLVDIRGIRNRGCRAPAEGLAGSEPRSAKAGWSA